jgi:hypothetical protein
MVHHTSDAVSEFDLFVTVVLLYRTGRNLVVNASP